MFYLLALVAGIIAGLRALTAPAAICWAARLGILDLSGTWLAFLGRTSTAVIFTVLALGELVTDQLPATPRRTAPAQFMTRIVTGVLAGAAVGFEGGSWIVGAISGAIGATIGTLGGYAFRSRLATLFGRDRPAAILEDAVAIGGALLVVVALR